MRRMLSRHWRMIVTAAALLVAIGLFLGWGPVGLGNGPVSTMTGGVQGWSDAARVPVGLVIPVLDSGHQPAVIDGVRFTGGAGYPAPRVFAVHAVTFTTCAGEWPLPAGPHGPLPPTCNARDLGPLVGHQVRFSPPDALGLQAVAEISPPKPDSCWALATVVIHYHVGIRHYAATDPLATVACTGRAATSANIDRAMAAGRAAPG
jgi:hypothetical protein